MLLSSWPWMGFLMARLRYKFELKVVTFHWLFCSDFRLFTLVFENLVQWRPLVLPDRYIDHGSPSDQLIEAGLTPSHIAATVFNILGQTREALKIMT